MASLEPQTAAQNSLAASQVRDFHISTSRIQPLINLGPAPTPWDAKDAAARDDVEEMDRVQSVDGSVSSVRRFMSHSLRPFADTQSRRLSTHCRPYLDSHSSRSIHCSFNAFPPLKPSPGQRRSNLRTQPRSPRPPPSLLSLPLSSRISAQL